MKVLIVDGSKESRRDTVEALGQLTNVVILGAVGNVRTALHALADAPPDLVVTDAALPDGEGAHLVERIKRLERSPSIVVMTAAPSDEQRERYLAAGVDHYVERDAELRGLQDAVAMLRGRMTVAPNDTLRLIGRMAAGTAHDLNNYLTAAGSLMSLIARHPGDGTLWTQLRAALAAMARLNTTMLTYARGASPEPLPIDLGVLVSETLATFGRLIPANVRLTTEISGSLRTVHGVQSELEQMVLNLVINACDSLRDGGALHVAVTRTASAAVHLRVADSGAGMELRARNGSLGLGIVQAVVTRHRGVVQFAQRPGGGTIVDVMLPAT